MHNPTMSTKSDRRHGSGSDALVARHNALLAGNADIRVLNRWGPWTEYAIKLKKGEAEVLLDASDAGAGPWRIVVALDEEGTTLGLQHFDAEDREWHDAFEYAGAESEGDVLPRVHLWLDQKMPAVRELLEIDRTMLQFEP